MKPIVLSVNVSEKKGVAKQEVREITLIKDLGIKGDAHAAPGDRQISMLAKESHDRFQPMTNVCLKNGIFGENITTQGIDLLALNIGDKLEIDGCLLEVSKKGKECHAPCSIAKKVGKCIMPKECIFLRVLKGGKIKKGAKIKVI